MKRRATKIFWLLAGLALAGCVATPLPTPPTADPARMSILDGMQTGDVDVRGEAGSIDGELRSLRITSSSAFGETTVAADGSFLIEDLNAPAPPTLYLEAITADDDLFLLAITRGAGTDAVETDAGPDRDADGSPDAVDCAPDDGALGGRRCPVTDADGDGFDATVDCDDGNGAVFPGAAETCNGLDDDCDGTIDIDCAGCAADSDCAAGQSCLRGLCM